MATRSRRAAPAKPTPAPALDPEDVEHDAATTTGEPDGDEVLHTHVEAEQQDHDADEHEAAGGAEHRDPEGDEVSKPAKDPTAKKAQPKVQVRAKEAAVPLVPGGSAAAARQASPSDFILAKIPAKYGSSTIYGRGGKETVHRGGEVVEMTRAQAERIGAVEAKKKARVEPEPEEDAEE